MIDERKTLGKNDDQVTYLSSRMRVPSLSSAFVAPPAPLLSRPHDDASSFGPFSLLLSHVRDDDAGVVFRVLDLVRRHDDAICHGHLHRPDDDASHVYWMVIMSMSY